MTSLATQTSQLPILDTLPGISLAQMNEQAALLKRVDRKYFVPRQVFAQILNEIGSQFRVLDMDGQRLFTYDTTYFDSPQFRFFRDHVQGKRSRYKVRTRTYRNSGDCMLEVKSKGYRGQTVKNRIPHPAHRPDRLSATAQEFIEQNADLDASALAPVLETVYERATLTRAGQRVTCDINFRCTASGQTYYGPEDVLVETKSSGSSSVFDAALKRHGVRPHSVSKYCVSAALLYPHLPANRWHRLLRRKFNAEPTVRAA